MRLRVASYNIHKAIGSDRRRDPGRVLDVIDSLDADIVALQEVDRRFGKRESVLDLHEIEERGWQAAAIPMRPDSLGWHGNAVLVRKAHVLSEVRAVELPRIEPRGALLVQLRINDEPISIASMHLDLTGLRRRSQLAALCQACRATGLPAIMLGDLNEWSFAGGGLRGLAAQWRVVTPGPSFPSRRPLLALDRIIHTPHWRSHHKQVVGSPLAQEASDHLPIWADLQLSASFLGTLPIP